MMGWTYIYYSPMKMTSLTFVIVLSGLIVAGQSVDIPEFQYPCYVDICTFPRQFCNSERFERRCSPCTRSICREKKVPLACKYICGQYEKPVTTAVPEPTKLASSETRDSASQDHCWSSFLLLSYSAISTTIILVLLLCFLTMRSINKRNKDKGKLSRTKDVKEGREVGDAEQRASLLERGGEGRVQTAKSPSHTSEEKPPSYTTSENLNDVTTVPVYPEEDSHPGHNGAHRQVCNTSTTTETREAPRTEKSRELAARPKYNNQLSHQQMHQQPVSAQFSNHNSRYEEQNTPNGRRENRSIGNESDSRSTSGRSIRSSTRGSTVSNYRHSPLQQLTYSAKTNSNECVVSDAENSDSCDEETSLKS